MKDHILVALLVLIGLVGLIAPAASLTECDDTNAVDLTVWANEHVELRASPYDPSKYTYDWAADSGIAVESGVKGQDFWFDAPSASGTYEISLIVTTIGAPSGTCAATTCYKITVIQCCPEVGGPWCESDTPNWCCPAMVANAGGLPDTSLVGKWYVNDPNFLAGVAGTPCLTAVNLRPDSTVFDWDSPTTAVPTKTQTVVTRIEQSSTGASHWGTHLNPKILTTCTDTFSLALDPTDDIDITKGFP